MKKNIFTVIITILFLSACKHDNCQRRCISLYVVDLCSGLPIKDAKVYFFLNESDGSSWFFPNRKFLGKVITDNHGFASMVSDTPIWKGTIEVYAEAANYEPLHLGNSYIQYQGWTPNKIALSPMGSVKVHLVDTSQNDVNVHIDFNGLDFYNLGLDTTFFLRTMAQTQKSYIYWIYRFGINKRFEKYIDIYGNDTAMVEIKF